MTWRYLAVAGGDSTALVLPEGKWLTFDRVSDAALVTVR